MSSSEQDKIEFCGIDADNLCMLPTDSHVQLENGVDDVESPQPIAYKHTSSGLGDLKNDIRRSMAERDERAAASAAARKKKRKKKKVLFSSKKVTAAEEAAAASSMVKSTRGGKEDAAVYTSDESGGEDSNIKANVFMISGCEDSQTSADVSNVSSFSLPDPNGRAGGTCTSALLKVLYTNGGAVTGLSFVQVLNRMRTILKQGSYSQIPQLTSSQQLDVSQDFYIVPPKCTGTKRAVMIGINYTGQNGELSGCHNDCLNMKDYIQNACGFAEENIFVLMDDGEHTSPTRENILSAYQAAAAASSSGDAVFCHYSGHGGRVRDDDYGEEEDGYDETLVPLDYASTGQIRDDDLYSNLVCAMPKGVTLVSLMDCCHSATVLDLPYTYSVDVSSGSGYHSNTNVRGCSRKSLICMVLCMAILFLVIVLPLYFMDS